MLINSPNQDQFHIFQPLPKQIINPKDKLVVLAQKMDWKLLQVAVLPKANSTALRIWFKVAFATTQKRNIMVGVASFAGNPHNSKTLEGTLEHVAKITGNMPQIAVRRSISPLSFKTIIIKMHLNIIYQILFSLSLHVLQLNF